MALETSLEGEEEGIFVFKTAAFVGVAVVAATAFDGLTVTFFVTAIAIDGSVVVTFVVTGFTAGVFGETTTGVSLLETRVGVSLLETRVGTAFPSFSTPFAGFLAAPMGTFSISSTPLCIRFNLSFSTVATRCCCRPFVSTFDDAREDPLKSYEDEDHREMEKRKRKRKERDFIPTRINVPLFYILHF